MARQTRFVGVLAWDVARLSGLPASVTAIGLRPTGFVAFPDFEVIQATTLVTLCFDSIAIAAHFP